MTPTETRALLFLALVAVLGAGVRMVRAPEPVVAEPAQRRALAAQLAAVDSARRMDSVRKAGGGKRKRASRKAAADQPATPVVVDVDRADSAALEVLPGIGPALARRIVEHRDRCGPFGSMDALTRVKGIGPALSKRLTPVVTFSRPPRPLNAVDGCGPAPLRRPRERQARDRS